MTEELVFYTNPMSRGRIVRRMLEETGAPYRSEIVESGPPAQVLEEHPAAMQLRILQTMTEVAAEQNSTLIFPLPMELLRTLDAMAPRRTE